MNCIRLAGLLALTVPTLACHAMHGSGPSLGELARDLEQVPLVAAEGLDQAAPGGQGRGPAPSVEGPVSIGVLPPLCLTRGYGGDSSLEFGAWSDDEHEVLEGWARGARAAGLVNEVRFLPSLLVPPGQDPVSAARTAGLAAGLDAVLVTRTGSTHTVVPSALSLLDVAIAPAFLIPSAEFQATAIVEGAILDARSGFAYAVGASEGRYERQAPSMIGDPAAYQRRARLAGLDEMTARMAAPHGVDSPLFTRERASHGRSTAPQPRFGEGR